MADVNEIRVTLENLLGTHNVYFQPPESLKMNFPAIVFKRKKIDNTHANNAVYRQEDQYEIIVIDYDPDSEIVRQVSLLPRCRHESHYVANNLNHDVFTKW